MKHKIFLLLLLPVLILSCDENFDVTAGWKDISIVYGLLNPYEADSVHYIRIERAFLNEGQDAMMIAQNPDSIYYRDSLYVTLDEFVNNNYKRTITLYREEKQDKDTTGPFASPINVLYRTPASTVISPDAVYKLTVLNTVTGKKVSSETDVVGGIQTIFPNQNQYMSFTFDNELKLQWLSGKNAYFYNLEVKIYYKEYKISNPSEKVQKTISWPVFTYRRDENYLEGGYKIEQAVKGQMFFDYLIKNIPVDYNVEREFVGMDFIFSAGGREIYYYIDINQPSVGTVQKKPEYTNIVNGFGVFSSRTQNVVRARLSPTSLNLLKTDDRTINLKFVR